ncbi:MAG: S1-like domain-containing RNA-binding protein [Andreesenia angusta]|nr:S1-like domain-containing RNA-binding protein [Andreesenia angusta]
MIELGKIQELEVKKKSESGSYLGEIGEEGQIVFLPKSQEGDCKNIKKGSMVEVFVYKDSEGRMVATTKKPLLEIGEIGFLKVISTTKIGAFLDWGLDKDILLPFREQLGSIKEGDDLIVVPYIDKTGRIAATMKIYNYLVCENPYKENQEVKGIVYDIKKDLGVLVAVDSKYHGLIHKEEVFHDFEIGQKVRAKVLRKRDDGKLDLSIGGKAYQSIDKDSKKIYELLLKNKGRLNLHDKSKPEEINRLLNMSKNSFKRAIGRLYKEGIINLYDNRIELKQKD